MRRILDGIRARGMAPQAFHPLEAAAVARGLPLNALIAAIDVERLDSAPPPNLTSALRQWLFSRGGGGGSDG